MDSNGREEVFYPQISQMSTDLFLLFLSAGFGVICGFLPAHPAHPCSFLSFRFHWRPFAVEFHVSSRLRAFA
jgi:hypothetical protein